MLAVAVAFFSASQDIVFDAYRADLLDAEERGAGAAVSVLGYRVAMLVSGGAALILADQWLGWPDTYRAMGLLMGVLALATLWCPGLGPSTAQRTPARAELSGFAVMVVTGALVWWLASQVGRWALGAEPGRFASLAVDTAVLVLTGLVTLTERLVIRQRKGA